MLETLLRYVGPAAIAVGLSGCLASLPGARGPATPAIDDARVACSDPRPMVCTMEYRPVCATLIDKDTRTYASGCNACADVVVASYLPDACGSGL